MRPQIDGAIVTAHFPGSGACVSPARVKQASRRVDPGGVADGGDKPRRSLGFLRCAIGLALSVILAGGGAVVGASDVPSDKHMAGHIADVIYGRKHGMALTMDVFRPAQNANGAAVIWVVSGGWVSTHAIATPRFHLAPIDKLVGRGYVVFAVVHGSQPRYTIPEILEDMHRAVRFIRTHAADYGIDPDRIGITGGSAGGHLSLMQGTAGAPGDPEAADPIDRASSRVQAVACHYPPTDFLNYGKPGENALGQGVLKEYHAPFDFHRFDPQRGKFGEFVPITEESEIRRIGQEISPVNHVTSDDAPTLILHGDADEIVPLQQAEIFVAKLKESGVAAELIVKKGARHGWANLPEDYLVFADWFDRYLSKK